MVIFDVPDTEIDKISKIEKILKPRVYKTEEQKKEEQKTRAKAYYHKKQLEKIAQGIEIRPRGRPRKNIIQS